MHNRNNTLLLIEIGQLKSYIQELEYDKECLKKELKIKNKRKLRRPKPKYEYA